MVILVGDKPSKYNKDPNIAFIGAKCEKRLLSWISQLKIEDHILTNSHDDKCINFIKANQSLGNCKFIALGNNASKVLNKLNVKHYKIDHPSGLNRKLNNRQYELNMLELCKRWLFNEYK